MPWIGDVVPYTTILSTWGNNIRNHVTHVFTSRAERDAQAVPTEGMIVHCADVHTTYIRVGSAWWVLGMPWRTCPVKAWAIPIGDLNSHMVLNIGSVIQGIWRQELGVAQFNGEYQAGLPPNTTPADYYIAVGGGPATTLYGGTAGQARVVPGATAVASGGGSSFQFHDSPTGSAWLIANAGNQVPSNAVVRSTTGPGNQTLFLSATLQFACDPAFDP